MIIFRYLIIIILSVYMTGCTNNNLKKEDIPEDMFAIIYGSDSIKNMNTDRWSLQKYQQWMYWSLGFLSEEDPEKYSDYINDYHKIAEGYRFLDDNRTFMNKDSIELLVRGLNVKKDVLCSRVKFESFQHLKNKFQ